MDESEIDDLFLDHNPTTHITGALAPVLVVAGAKGGVGATTVAIAAAEMARTSGGIPRVVLVDADPANSHVATYLRAKTSGPGAVPTILDGALRRDYRKAVVSPDSINAGHAARVPDISMHTVLAPPPVQYDPSVVSPSSYANAMRLLRPGVDLIVINAGNLTSNAPTPLQEAFVYPILRTGGWLLLVSNSSRPSVQSALTGAQQLTSTDIVTPERTFSLINARRAAMNDAAADTIAERMAPYSTPLGAVDYDEKGIGDRMESGHIPSTHPQLVQTLSEALHLITGFPSFAELASGKRKPGDRTAEAEESVQAVTRGASKRRRLIPSRSR